MSANQSVDFFDRQFRQQVQAHDVELNPFEQMALPHLRGRVLDFGCGMGNLAVAAARQGCSVLAVDASATAIDHLQQVARDESLAIEARQADLRGYALAESFDTVVCIGLLMFFDRPTALRSLASLQAHVTPGGTAIVNLLVQGTTYLDMFDPASHCLLARGELQRSFAGWTVLSAAFSEFTVPDGRLKVFETVIAIKPAAA